MVPRRVAEPVLMAGAECSDQCRAVMDAECPVDVRSWLWIAAGHRRKCTFLGNLGYLLAGKSYCVVPQELGVGMTARKSFRTGLKTRPTAKRPSGTVRRDRTGKYPRARGAV
jgi:hypothetical protein